MLPIGMPMKSAMQECCYEKQMPETKTTIFVKEVYSAVDLYLNCLSGSHFIRFMQKIRLYIGLAVFFISFISCNVKTAEKQREISRSFYYWKSVFELTDFEKQEIKDLKIEALYVKFFDVGWNATKSKPTPIAVIRIKDKDFFKEDKQQIIPTVFITNETLYKINIAQCKGLAADILNLIRGICTTNEIQNVREIQIDCDWTAETKEKFFSIIDNLKVSDSSYNYSATIRLHQIKYVERAGVPIVNRGMLMAYNMGNLKNPGIKNSILEVDELKKYSSYISNYPLPLDVALPLFDWCVIFRNGVYVGLMQNLDIKDLKELVLEKGDNKYLVKRDSIVNGFEFKMNDVIRHEKSDYKEVIAAANIIAKQLNSISFRVALFHLDSTVLKKYTTNELENIYNSFR